MNINKRVPYSHTNPAYTPSLTASTYAYTGTMSRTNNNMMTNTRTANGDDIRNNLFASSSTNRQTNGFPSSSSSTSASSSHSSSSSSNANAKLHTERTESLFEQQNTDLTDQLHEKVTRLKALTINIGSEIKDSNKYLDTEFSGTMDQITANMKSTMTKLSHMIQTGGSKHMCYLILFMLLIFLSIWYLIR